MKEKKIDTQKITSDNIQHFTNEILQAKCIFIHGPDAFQKDRCFKYIMDLLLPKVSLNPMGNNANDGLNTFLFYGHEYNTEKAISAVLDTLNIISFDLSEKIISLKYFEELEKKSMEKIAKYTENPNPSAKLIIVSDKLDTRIGACKTIIANCLHIETTEMKYTTDLIKWLNIYLKDNPIYMDDDAKQFFTTIVEPDTFIAFNEMKKLELYIGNNRKISLDDVKNCTVNSKTYTVFDLQEAIGLRQKNKALIIAENMIDNGESIIMVNSILTTFFFNLWKWDALRRQGVSNSELMSKYMGNIHQFIKTKNLNYLNNFNQAKIAYALKHLYLCDCRAKLSMAEEKVLVTSLVIEMLK
ncbi:MAG: DNA polymerase III subunit delta [Candidatus Cloacimonetes bacterium]|nr:DNA polymerase III subunit delta [Candidatus Cloacimonadota bacterium]